MKQTQLLIFFVVLLFGVSLSQAYEDTPFSFHAEVSDSVMFVMRGVEYQEFDLEYFPGDQELYLNGVPVFQLWISAEKDDCWDFLREIETALGYFRSGLSCSQSYFRYENDKNVLAWDVGDWLDNSNQSNQSDFLLTLKLFRHCRPLAIAPDIKGLFVWNGRAYMHFAGVRFSEFHVRRIPLAKERTYSGGRTMPFREQALVYSRNLVMQIQKEHRQTSTIYAISRSGGSMSKGGIGMVLLGRQQLKSIQENGEYVKGPIPKGFFEER